MARYRITAKTFLHGMIRDPELSENHPNGPVIEVANEVVPGPHWIPLDEPARAATARYEEAFIKSQGHHPSLTPVEQLPQTIVVKPAPPPDFRNEAALKASQDRAKAASASEEKAKADAKAQAAADAERAKAAEAKAKSDAARADAEGKAVVAVNTGGRDA